MKKSTFVCIILMLIPADIFSESLRGRIAGSLSASYQEVVCLPEEIIVVQSGMFPEYQDGMELHFTFPEDLIPYQQSFALLVFKDISPAPTEENPLYEGTRIFMNMLKSRDFMYLRIPFREDHQISRDALTQIIPAIVYPEDFPLLITIVPIIKGIPSQALEQEITVSSAPIWRDEGRIKVSVSNLSGDPEEIVSARVNDKEINLDTEIIIQSGIHTIHITSTHAQTVEKTFILAPGDDTEIAIELDYSPPLLTFRLPPEARIILDDEVMDITENHGTVEIERGEHEITVILGDLSISRRFSVAPADRINIELLVDLKITDYRNESGHSFGSGDG